MCSYHCKIKPRKIFAGSEKLTILDIRSMTAALCMTLCFSTSTSLWSPLPPPAVLLLLYGLEIVGESPNPLRAIVAPGDRLGCGLAWSVCIILAHAIALDELALEAVGLKDAGLAFVLCFIVLVALHCHGIDADGVEVRSAENGLFRSLDIENPNVNVLHAKLLMQSLRRQALHSGELVDAGFVVVYASMPLLEEGGRHEFHESSHRKDSQARIVQNARLAAQGSVDIDGTLAICLEAAVILRIRLCAAMGK